MTAKVWIPTNPVGFPSGVTSAQAGAWIEEFRQAMLEIGLVQTADTGQFNVATHTTVAGGTNNSPGAFDVECYMVFRFNDAHQATAPIFIKIEILKGVGSDANGHIPASRVTVGTGTNGAGTITGALTSIQTSWGQNLGAPANNYQSWACYDPIEGFFTVLFSAGAWTLNNVSPVVAVAVERIPESNGNPSASGFTVFAMDHQTASAGGGGTTYNSLPALASKTVMTPSGVVHDSLNHAIPYFRTTDSYTTGLFLTNAVHSTPFPVRAKSVGMIRKGAVSKGTEFEAIVYGTTPINYVAFDETVGVRPNNTNTNGVAAFALQ